LLNDGKEEGQRFAVAGLGGNDPVLAGHKFRESGILIKNKTIFMFKMYYK
jgi:hypothetical protein